MVCPDSALQQGAGGERCGVWCGVVVVVLTWTVWVTSWLSPQSLGLLDAAVFWACNGLSDKLENVHLPDS